MVFRGERMLVGGQAPTRNDLARQKGRSRLGRRRGGWMKEAFNRRQGDTKERGLER